MARRMSPLQKAWEFYPANALLLGAFLVIYFGIMTLFTSYTHNLDEIKPTMQFMFLPLLMVGVFFLLYQNQAAPIPPLIWVPLAAHLGIFVISALFAEHPWRAWFSVGWHYSIFVPFFLIPACIKSVRGFRIFTQIYVCLGLAITLFGIFHYFGGVNVVMNVLYPFGRQTIERDRFYDVLFTLANRRDMFATILNTDFFGAYLVMIFPLAINMFMAPYQRLWEPIVGLTTMLLTGVAVILTRSNDSQGVFFIIGVFYFIMVMFSGHAIANRKQVLYTLGVGCLIIMVSIVGLYWYNLKTQVDNMLTMGMSSRGIIFRGGWDMFLERPLLGWGPGSFYLIFPQFRAPHYYENAISNITLYAHNMYLDFLAEEGIFGLLTFLAFAGAFVYLAFRQIFSRGSHYLRTCQIGMLAAFLGVSVQNFFSPNTRWTVCAINYWTLLGMITSCIMLGLREHDFLASQPGGDGPDAEGDEEPASVPSGHTEQATGLSRWATGVNLKWTRRVGLWGMVISSVLAVGMFVFGVRYWMAAYNNNEGIIQMNYAEQLEAHGDRASARRFYDSAIERFNDSVAWWPGFITAFYKLAHAYSKVGDDAKALETYLTLAEYAPDYSEIHRNFGIIYQMMAMGQQNAQQRDDYLRASLDAYIRSAQVAHKIGVQMSLAQAYRNAQRFVLSATEEEKQRWRVQEFETLYATAMREHRLQEDIRDQRDLRQDLASELWTEANRLKAEEAFEQADVYFQWTIDLVNAILEGDRISDMTLVANMVESLRELGRNDEAEEFLKRKIENEIWGIDYYDLLARHYLATGAPDQAAQVFHDGYRMAEAMKTLDPMLPPPPAIAALHNSIVEQNTPTRFLFAAVQTAHENGDPDKSLEWGQELLRNDPASTEAAEVRALFPGIVP